MQTKRAQTIEGGNAWRAYGLVSVGNSPGQQSTSSKTHGSNHMHHKVCGCALPHRGSTETLHMHDPRPKSSMSVQAISPCSRMFSLFCSPASWILMAVRLPWSVHVLMSSLRAVISALTISSSLAICEEEETMAQQVSQPLREDFASWPPPDG